MLNFPGAPLGRIQILGLHNKTIKEITNQSIYLHHQMTWRMVRFLVMLDQLMIEKEVQ